MKKGAPPLALALWVGLASAAAAQTVVGILCDDLTGSPIPNGVVVLLRADGSESARVGTQADGQFALGVREAGDYRVWARAVGYEELLAGPVHLSGRGDSLELRLRPIPISLDPLLVTAEARQLLLTSVGFYERARLGIGRFITAEIVETRRARTMTDLLRTEPSIRALTDPEGDGGAGTVVYFRGTLRGLRMGGGRPCLPTIVVDGFKVRDSGVAGKGGARFTRLDELVQPGDIAGVELYPSGAGAAVQWSGMDAGCGVIVIWTKRHQP